MSALCRDCLWKGERAPEGRRCPACGSPRIAAHAELDRLSISHLDCDAFYASVEKRDRPELRDQPVIVGGGVRGVVTTCCYIARTFGVRSAMPMFKARALCPEAIIIKPDFSKYRAESRRVMAILGEMTPLVQPLSLDEAWLDLAGSERLNGGSAAFQMARAQNRIEREIGITVSVGLAANKVMAKIASDLDKPRGFSVIGAEEAQGFLAPRPVTLLPGVGPAFARKLEKDGYRRIGDVARADPKRLAALYGVGGARLYELAHARDSRAVNPDQEAKSISAETTFNVDLSSLSDLEDALWPLCEKVAARARHAGLAGRVAVLKLKTAEFRGLTRRRTLATPIQTARGLFHETRELLAPETQRGLPYRLIGAGLTELVEAAEAERDLFAGEELKARRAEWAMDQLRAKFGRDALMSGRSLKPRS